MPGIGIVINPKSRTCRRNPDDIKRLGYILGDRGTLEETKDLSDIWRVAEEFKKKEVDIICIGGGDGTNHRTLTTFLKVYKEKNLPLISFLRGGTMNTIAGSCGIKGSPSDILFNIVQKYHNNEEFQITERDILKIDDRYGFIFGNGIVDSFLRYYYKKGRPSPFTAFLILSKAILSVIFNGNLAKELAKKIRSRVYVDGKLWPQEEFLGLFIATIRDIGFNFKFFYRALEIPGNFHFIGLNEKLINLLKEMPNFYFGRPTKHEGILETLAKEVVIESNEPIRYTIDGDLHTKEGNLHIKIGPRLKIIQR